MLPPLGAARCVGKLVTLSEREAEALREVAAADAGRSTTRRDLSLLLERGRRTKTTVALSRAEARQFGDLLATGAFGSNLANPGRGLTIPRTGGGRRVLYRESQAGLTSHRLDTNFSRPLTRRSPTVGFLGAGRADRRGAFAPLRLTSLPPSAPTFLTQDVLESTPHGTTRACCERAAGA
jgi:hypothetical protein